MLDVLAVRIFEYTFSKSEILLNMRKFTKSPKSLRTRLISSQYNWQISIKVVDRIAQPALSILVGWSVNRFPVAQLWLKTSFPTRHPVGRNRIVSAYKIAILQKKN